MARVAVRPQQWLLVLFRVDFEWPGKLQGMASCTRRPGSRSSALAVGPLHLSLPSVWRRCP